MHQTLGDASTACASQRPVVGEFACRITHARPQQEKYYARSRKSKAEKKTKLFIPQSHSLLLIPCNPPNSKTTTTHATQTNNQALQA